jgi:hypothetical protein
MMGIAMISLPQNTSTLEVRRLTPGAIRVSAQALTFGK